MKISKATITMAILIVWALVSVVYIVWDNYGDFKTTKLSMALNQGYSQAFIDIGAAVEKCQEVPLNVGAGKTINIVSVECLKQAQQSQTNAPAVPAATTPKK